MKRVTWNLTLTDGTKSPVSLELDPYGPWEVAVEKIIDLGQELERRRNKERVARQMLDIAIHAAMHVGWLHSKHPKILAKIVRDVDAVPVLISPRRAWFEKSNEMPESVRKTMQLAAACRRSVLAYPRVEAHITHTRKSGWILAACATRSGHTAE